MLSPHPSRGASLQCPWYHLHRVVVKVRPRNQNPKVLVLVLTIIFDLFPLQPPTQLNNKEAGFFGIGAIICTH